MIEDSKLQERYAREEQKMGNENDEPNSGEVFRPRTTADLIQEAARVVNWRPDEKYSQQARYDAALALSSLYAYWTTVALETLRRLDPAAAERVTSHIDDDLGWADAHEHAYGWEQALDAGKPIPSDAWPFWEILGRPDIQPAGEHHTGSLDLTGEGNAPVNPIPHAAVTALATHLAWSASWETYSEETRNTLIACTLPTALAALEAAYPAIRQQVAEEIAAKADEIAQGYAEAARIQRALSIEKGSAKGESNMRTALAFRNKADGAWAVAHAAREVGAGTATARTEAPATTDLPPAPQARSKRLPGDDIRARIIADLTARRAEITEGMPGWVYLTEAIGIAERGLL